MTWNYRVIKHDTQKPAYFAVHEVFYDKGDQITRWTKDPIRIIGETLDEISKAVEQMLKDIKRHPVLNESELLLQIRQDKKNV